MTVRVFVYGTLKRDERIGRICSEFMDFIDEDAVEGFHLFQRERENYPRAFASEGKSIYGEVVDMNSEFLHQITNMESSAAYVPMAVKTHKGHTALLFISMFGPIDGEPQMHTWTHYREGS